MDYTALKAAVAGYIHRSDLTTQIPDFIETARRRIGADLRALCNYQTATISSWTTGLGALPTDVSKLVAVVESGGTPLLYVPLEHADLIGSGVYSVSGTNMYVPDAGASTIVAVAYFAVPSALVNGTDVSDGMAEYPQLWVYAATAEAALYCQEYELADRMLALYKAQIEDANRAGNEARIGPAPATSGDQYMIQQQSTL